MPLITKLPQPGDRVVVACWMPPNVDNSPVLLASGNGPGRNSTLTLCTGRVLGVSYDHYRTQKGAYDAMRITLPKANGESVDCMTYYVSEYVNIGFTQLITSTLSTEQQRFIAKFVLPQPYADGDYVNMIRDIAQDAALLPLSVEADITGVLDKARELGFPTLQLEEQVPFRQLHTSAGVETIEREYARLFTDAPVVEDVESPELESEDDEEDF